MRSTRCWAIAAASRTGWWWRAAARSCYFDVRRRTLRGTVIVRAAVAEWVEAGTWDADSGAVVRVTREKRTSVPLCDYTLRQRGDVWKVVDRAATERRAVLLRHRDRRDVERAVTGARPCRLHHAPQTPGVSAPQPAGMSSSLRNEP